MARTEIKIKTWGCDGCDYAQDFEQTQENINKHFKTDREFVRKRITLQPGRCPACALRGVTGNMLPVTSTEKKMLTTIIGEEEIEGEIVLITERRATTISDAAAEGNDEPNHFDNPDLSTTPQQDAYRATRKADIAAAIVRARQFEDTEE